MKIIKTLNQIIVSVKIPKEDLELLIKSKANHVTLSDDARDVFAFVKASGDNAITQGFDLVTDDGYIAFAIEVPDNLTSDEFVQDNFDKLNKIQKTEAILQVKARQLKDAHTRMSDNVTTVEVRGE